MNEFFGRLVQRAWGPNVAPDLVQPRLPSRFELFNSSGGESAPSDALSPAQTELQANQTQPIGALESAPLPEAGRLISETATLAAQGADLPPERRPTNQRAVAVQTQPNMATLFSNATPLAAPQLVEPQSQPTALKVQTAAIQPLLTPAPLFRTVVDPTHDANGQVRRVGEGANIAPPTVERPVIQVTIGRIEVRAVSAPSPARPAPPPRQPAQSLDDYLHGRKGGTR